MTKKYDMCMLGLGPVGTISAACIAHQGFNVIGADINAERIKAFEDGCAPFTEPGVNDLIKNVQQAGTFHVTTDMSYAIQNSRIIMIAVGTPTPVSGAPDLSQLDSVSQTIGNALKDAEKGTIVVVRSTVPPGTMRNRIAKQIEASSGLKAGIDFFVASNPEFLREGRAIEDFFNTGRVVIGTDNEQVALAIEELYKDVIGQRMHTTIETAEFAKYVDNTWHALKVSFANEIGRVCTAFGGNPDQTANIFLADHHLNISEYYMKPGAPFGGSCLPKDVRGLSYLAETLGVNIPVIEAILPSNEEQIDQGVKAVLAAGNNNVGILGIAFKENVDDLRESASLAISAKLKKHGLSVIAHDPCYPEGSIVQLPHSSSLLSMSSLDELVARSSTLVLMHNSPAYRQLAKEAQSRGIIIIDLTKIIQISGVKFATFTNETPLVDSNEIQEELQLDQLSKKVA